MGQSHKERYQELQQQAIKDGTAAKATMEQLKPKTAAAPAGPSVEELQRQIAELNERLARGTTPSGQA